MTLTKTCTTCLYMATHEQCDGCLTTEEDYKAYRAGGVMPDFRYLHHVESDPLAILTRLHMLQLEGKRNIILGAGEADFCALSTPEDVSKHLHYVAEECGYHCQNLQHDKATGRKTLILNKDGGPFCIAWQDDKLVRIIDGDGGIFWDVKGVLI